MIFYEMKEVIALHYLELVRFVPIINLSLIAAKRVGVASTPYPIPEFKQVL